MPTAGAGSGSAAPPPSPGGPPTGVDPGAGGRGPATGPGGGRGLAARGGLLLALTVSVLALLLSGGSTLLAWRALDQARDAKDIALGPDRSAVSPIPATGGDGSTATPGTAGPGQTDPPAPELTDSVLDDNLTGPPPLDEQTVYTELYVRRELTLRAYDGNSMNVDLDEPRANVASIGSDLSLRSSYENEPDYLALGDGVEGSESEQPDLTPQECAERIQLSPLGNDTPVPVRQGVVLCLVTSFEVAESRGDPRRMVLVEITGVAADGRVTIAATAWNIPS